MPTAKTSLTTVLRESSPPTGQPAMATPEYWSDDNSQIEIMQGEDGGIYILSEDGQQATIGTTTDAAASGNGTLVGLLKRIRDILSQTVGGAINALAVPIAGTDGTNARVLMTSSTGEIHTIRTGTANDPIVEEGSYTLVADNGTRTQTFSLDDWSKITVTSYVENSHNYKVEIRYKTAVGGFFVSSADLIPEASQGIIRATVADTFADPAVEIKYTNLSGGAENQRWYIYVKA